MSNITPDVLQQMLKTIQHRGPDHLGSFSMGDLHLAHARLSVIDLSVQSHQPLWDQQRKICIVFNGEIYNYQRIRHDLMQEGVEFLSEGDAEVIVQLYRRDGVRSFAQLHGMFAFVLWDSERQELYVVRDRFGVKPLYYTQNDEGFFFASEMKALLAVPSIVKDLDYDALFRILIFLWSPGPQTVMKQILKLEPGHYLVVKDQKIIANIAYSQNPCYQPQSWSIQQACEKIDEALRASVEEQCVADVPLGAFLSGGLDSSLIVAMAKNKQPESLSCFTIESLHSDGFVDDLPYAKRVAAQLNVPLHIVTANPKMVQFLSVMLEHLDEPQADPAPLNVLLICEAARKLGIKVLLSGAGGDDLFSGYRRHHAVVLEKYWSFLPRFLRRGLEKGSQLLPQQHPFFRRITKLFHYASCSQNERILSYFYWIKPQQARALFTDEIQKKLSADPLQRLRSELNEKNDLPALEKMLYLEQRYFLVDHNFNYTDKMSMAHGVEVRVPFLDRRVLEVASQLHVSLKHRYGQGKWILKKMAEKYLPKDVIYRSKSGFGAPLRHWLKHDLKDLVDEVLSESSVAKRGLFKFDAIRDLIEADRQGKADYSYPIFALICIECWCRIFMDHD